MALLFPLQFKRQYSGPLDEDMSMTTAQRTAYLSSPVRYKGQMVYDNEENKWYYLSGNLGSWLELGSGGTVTWNNLTGKPTYYPTNLVNVEGLQAALDAKASINYVDSQFNTLVSGLTWKRNVELFEELATDYPNPIEGWTVTVNAEGKIYRWDSSNWVPIKSSVDIPLATTTTEGLMSAADKTKLDGLFNYTHPAIHYLEDVSGLEDSLNNLSERIDNIVVPESTFTTNIPVILATGETFGKYKNGDTVPAAGKTIQEVITDALRRVIAPTYQAPTASISATPSLANREVGETFDLTLDATFTQRDGGSLATTSIRKNGVQIATSEPYLINDNQVTENQDSFVVVYGYAQGPIKNDNVGTPNATGRIPAGTVTSSALTMQGYRKAFYGTSGNVTTSSGIRELQNSLLNPGTGSTFTINIPIGATSVEFSYPATLRDVSSVKYVEGLGAEVKGIFISSTVMVEGANGYAPVAYKTFKYIPAEAFKSTATYNVTI